MTEETCNVCGKETGSCGCGVAVGKELVEEAGDGTSGEEVTKTPKKTWQTREEYRKYMREYMRAYRLKKSRGSEKP